MTDVPLTISHAAGPAEPAVLDLTMGELLAAAAADVPDGVALVAGVPDESARRAWTFAELLDDAQQVARALAARFEPGERVAVWAPNIPEWIMLEFGAGMAGVILVTVNPAFRASELAYVLNQSRAAGLFVMDEFRGNPMRATATDVQPDCPELREIIPFSEWDDFIASGDSEAPLPEVDPGDAVMIQYTSGTTGFPKGALLHHRGLVTNAAHTLERMGAERGGVYVNPMPLFHTGGCVLGGLGTVASRSTHVLVESFDPGLVIDLIEQYGGTSMLGVPTMLVAIIEHPRFAAADLSTVKAVCSGGSTVPAPLVRKLEESLQAPFTIVFGQTECSPVASQTQTFDSIDDKADTIGPPMPNVEVKIIDPAMGDTVPIGEIGEYCTRGYHVMHGYFENPEATAVAIDDDGWLHTGDLCAMDSRGYCTVEGRLKDMIIRGGENIYPRELEELLFAHDAVGDVAVVGLPDDNWGETVAAFVRPSPGSSVDPAALRGYMRDNFAPHKTPAQWFAVEDFPLTGSGKIQKFRLREMVEKGELDPL